jgi:hypothetical protein
MQDDDFIYNAMHSDVAADGSISMLNHPNPAVHGPERLPSITDARSFGLLVHSLYVGSRDGKAFFNADRQVVIDATTASFNSFTVVDADGYFKGRSVATMIIKIATDDGASVETLARELGRLLEQEAVGLERAGTYRSIIMD